MFTKLFALSSSNKQEALPTKIFPNQVSNQEFYWAGEVSWNEDTSINNYLQHTKERPRREKLESFFS